MKTNKYILYLLTLVLTGWINCSNAQSSCTNTHLTVETSVPQNVTVCGGSVVFSVTVKNISSLPFQLKELFPGMPEGMVYVQGSLSPSASITEGSIFSLNNPQFLFNNYTINSGATLIVQFSAKASCKLLNQQGSGNAVNNLAKVTYLSGAATLCAEEASGGSETYNVLFADLLTSFTVTEQSQIARVGDLKNRTLTVKNDGTGALSLFRLKVDYTTGNSFDHITNNNITLATYTTTATGIILTLDLVANTQIQILGGDNDRLLENGEYVLLKEYSLLSYCNYSLPIPGTYQSDFKALWGCNTDPILTDCNLSQSESKVSAFINTSIEDPIIQIETISNTKTSFCNAPAQVVYSISNLSSGTYASILYGKDLAVNFIGESGFSMLGNFILTNEAGTLNLPISPTDNGGQWVQNFNGLYTTDPDGAGGLSDADGDGFFDDLAAGAVIYVKYTVAITCTSDITTAPSNYYHYISEIYSYATGNCNSLAYSNFLYFQFYHFTNSQNISGPTDLQAGSPANYTFTINRYGSNADASGMESRGMMDCSQERYYAVFNLPPWYKYVNGSASFNGVPLVASVVGNIVQVEGGGLSGSYSIQVELDCSVNGGTATTGDIVWNMYHECNSCSSCKENIASTSYQVYNHCNSCQGFHTNSFNAKRFTFGKIEPSAANGYPGYHTDLTYASAPSVNETTPGVKLDAAYECDSIKMIAKGFLNLSGYTPDEAHVKISYTSPFFSNIFDYAYASWTLISAGVTTVYPNTSLPQYTLNGNQVLFDFKAPASIASSIQAGDSLYLTATFAITKSSQISLGQFTIPAFRAEHYGIQNNTNSSCESFGTSFSIYKTRANIMFASYRPYTCQESYSLGAAIRYDGGTGGDDFPSEYRPIGHINDITVTLPYGYKWVPTSRSDYLIHEVNWASFGFHSVDVGHPSISGNVLSWSRNNPSNINSWPLDERPWTPWSVLFLFGHRPDCSVVPNGSVSFNSESVQSSVTVANYDYAPSACKETSSYFGSYSGFNTSYRNLQVSADVLQEGFTSNVTWPIRISNFNARDNASFTWIKFTPKSTIHLTGATRDGLPLTVVNLGNNRYMIEVGTVNTNTLATVNLLASYTNCVNDFVEDSIYLTVGSGCSSYPASFEDHDCFFPVVPSSPLQLQLRYKTSNMSFDMTNSPSGNFNLCENMPFEFTLTSTQYANLHNVNFWMVNNNDVQIIPGSVYYTHPYTGTASDVWKPLATAPDNSNGNGTSGWKFSGTTGVIPTMNPEFQGSSTGAGFDKFKIKFDVAAGCSFDPGVLLKFQASAITNCNDALSFLKKKKIKISGVDVDSIGMKITTSSFSGVDNSSLVSITLTNHEPLSSKIQNLKFTMPDKLTYLSSSSSLAALSSSTTSGVTTVNWQIPAINSGSNYILTFKVQLSNVNNNGTTAQISATSSEKDSALCVATNTQCHINATTADTSLTIPLCYPIPLPDFTIFTICEGTPVLTNRPSTLRVNNPVVNAVYEWDFNNDNILDLISTSTEVQHLFATAGLFQVKLNYRVPSCGAVSNTKPITIKSFDGSATAGEICNGQPTTISVQPSDLAANDYVWYRNDSLQANLHGPVQTVNKAGIYKIVIKSFSCVTNMAFFDAPIFPLSIVPPPPPRLFSLTSIQQGTDVNYIAAFDVVIIEKFCPVLGCGECISPFIPRAEETYVLSAWVKEDLVATATVPVLNYPDPAVKIEFYIRNAATQQLQLSSVSFTFNTVGDIIESWQKVQGEFQPPVGTVGVKISLISNTQHDIYYDDIRIHPFNSNMKSFVFDPITQRLMAELDENNYASYYEYDKEGKLVRVKKETERGVKTIQESRENLNKR